MAPTQKQFRFASKNIFLTFAQCNLLMATLLDHLKHLLSNLDIIYISVCSELHASGDPHLHAMVQLKKPLQTRNPRFFDYNSDRNNFHPSFEPLRNPRASKSYIQKDGNFIEEGEFQSNGKSPHKPANKVWQEILQKSTDENDFYKQVKMHRPADFVLRWPAISSFAKDHYNRNFIPYTPQFENFVNLPDNIREWANNNVLCVSKTFVQYDLCYECSKKAMFETECPISLLHNFYCDNCRSPSLDLIVHEASTSVDQAEQERHPGQDPSDYIIISQTP
ncbi:putative RepA protein [Camellia chlorotic dwarf-associated virus]|uniref:Replication-associated protein n=1 Tax=Camellia chlorotic dwarf-associated virus TaxID=2122733 RepID=A0A2P1JHH9_9GEMI|nr:putative RepA protein [Camellia chlorotic dwarf-associated virus]AVN97897.1 putative RepA protein [Camellia chlorotic dwarf-associated virus]